MEAVGFKTQSYKNTNYQLNLIENNTPDVETLIKIKGMQEGIKILQMYFDNKNYPLLNLEQRTSFFMEKLQKIKERYFDDI